MTRPPRPTRLAIAALLLTLISSFVYLPALGRNGLRSTEGHRTIPAWTILETGEWLPTRMFEAVYVRKPPGMPWAIALSSSLLGQTEFAARLPSALASILAALLVFVFAYRWFGCVSGALAAGLAQALAPGLWAPGRSAEIESLNNLFTALLVYALIDLLVHQRARRAISDAPRSPAPPLLAALALALGLFGIALMKGPASIPVAIAAFIGACIAVGWKPALKNRWAWAGLALGLAATAALAFLVIRSMREAAPAPDQAAVSDKLVFWHLWRESDLAGVLALAPLTFAGALPGALALLFPFGPDARAETRDDPAALARLAVARALAWGFLAAIAIYLLIGVSNPRYTMPASVFAAPAVAYVFRALREHITPARRRIARVMMLGHPLALLTLLIAAAAWWITIAEPRRGADSGRAAGEAIAAHLPDGAEIWADELVESRPETLLYAQRAAARQGRDVRPLWKPGLAGEWRDGLHLALVRSGGIASGEEALARSRAQWRLVELAVTRVHVYETAIYRVERAQ